MRRIWAVLTSCHPDHRWLHWRWRNVRAGNVRDQTIRRSGRTIGVCRVATVPRRLGFFAVGVTIAACGRDLVVVCAGVGLPAVAVTVLDGQTGAGVAAGASLVLHSAACADSIVGVTDNQVLAGCVDYAGTYDVTVRKPGFRTWTQSNVVVRDTCSLETRRFIVRLDRLP